MVLLYIIFSFDNMFQNAFKCDMVSTTCSKMPSNATWFRQHVPKCSQMRHGFDNKCDRFRRPLFCWVLALGPGPSSACTRVLCMHKSVVHAQESCACTRILGLKQPLLLGCGAASGGFVVSKKKTSKKQIMRI